MGQKVIIRLWWESGLSCASRIHLTTFRAPLAHYACLGLCSAIVYFIQNNCLYFVCYGWSVKTRQNVGLENMNMTSNYYVANNAHQIQMTPYATEWTSPLWKFSEYATDWKGTVKVSNRREKWCLHVIRFEIFIHTSVNIIFEIIIRVCLLVNIFCYFLQPFCHKKI